MPIVYTGLPIVLSKFPDYERTIKRLFRENETFKTLCEDYRRCSKALRHWKESSSEEAPARRDEYEALQRDLETEILQSLNEFR